VRLRVRDETTAGGHGAEQSLELTGRPATLRDVIRGRVEADVAEFNATRDDVYRGLVVPTDAEQTLNGPRVQRAIDAGRQVAAALEAFERGRLLVLVDGRQREALDEPLELGAGSEVVFVRLVPLAGG
jgi:hypothetical protein